LLLKQDKMVKVIQEKNNELFSRKEVQLEVEAKITPSQEEAKKIVCDQFRCKEDVVRIKKIDGKFGSQQFLISANIYSSKEEFDRIVNKTKQEIEAEKRAVEDAKKAAEEAKVAAEAVPALEVKEEVTEERLAEVKEDSE
jgi:ribosomal protein S24E